MAPQQLPLIVENCPKNFELFIGSSALDTVKETHLELG